MTDADTVIPGFRPDQLAGFRIGVTSDRRSEDLIDALERRGAQVLHAPTLRIAGARDDDALIRDTRAIIETRPGILLATTSYGIRRWFEVADAAGLGHDLLEAIGRSDILVRGPKARGSIRATGLDDSGMSDEETTASLVDKVIAEYPSGTRVAVQLHGFTDEFQLNRLRQAGMTVLTVAPYRWETPGEADERVVRLIEQSCAGLLDCLTFTSAPAVDALFNAAEDLGRLDELLSVLRTSVVCAAVGPVTAAPLIRAGITPIQPGRYRMGALIRLVCEYLEQHRVDRVQTPYGVVVMRGSQVSVEGRLVQLAPTAALLMRTLLQARGAVVSRTGLKAILPGSPDDHALEVSLSRLRAALGEPGLVATVVKRGYRINV